MGKTFMQFGKRKGGVEKLNWQQAVEVTHRAPADWSVRVELYPSVQATSKHHPTDLGREKTHTHIYAICLYKVA